MLPGFILADCTDVAARPAASTRPFFPSLSIHILHIYVYSSSETYIQTDIIQFYKWRLYYSYNSYYFLRIEEENEIFVKKKTALFYLTKL